MYVLTDTRRFRRKFSLWRQFPLHFCLVVLMSHVPEQISRGIFMSVNRTELIAAIADRSGLSKSDADKVIAALQEVLVDSLSKAKP